MGKGEDIDLPDLICLIDADSSVRLRVLGRNRPGDTPYNDHLDAELVITSAFRPRAPRSAILYTQVTGDRCPGGRLSVRLGRLARA
ncbi:DUF5959 family protein [Streptomyces antibioticus]|uniref:DUF5959 family protein n=1 Tax=Streptomyces antibioticus TaxID=1890 RepID=UPI00369DE587